MQSREGPAQQTIDLFNALRDSKPLDTIMDLVNAGADLTQKNVDGMTVVHYASFLKRWDVVTRIANEKPTKAEDLMHYTQALTLALKSDQFDCVMTLIRAKTSGDCHDHREKNMPLCLAIEKDRLDILNLLLDNSNCAYGMAQNQIALEFAASLGKWNFVSVILNKTKDRGVIRSSVIFFRAIRADRPIQEIIDIVDQGASLIACEDNQTPIEWAAKLGHWKLVEDLILLAKEKKLSPVDLHYHQTLIYAVRHGNEPVCKLLLENGATCTESDDEKGNIALYYAVTEKSDIPHLILLLLSHGADWNQKNKAGESVYDLAIKLEKYSSVQDFLQYEFNTYNEKEMEVKDKFIHLLKNPLPCKEISAKLQELEAALREMLESDIKKLIKLQKIVQNENERAELTYSLRALQAQLANPHIQIQAKDEDQHLKLFCARMRDINNYKKRIAIFLDVLEFEILNTPWKKAKLIGGGWKDGMPTHIKLIKQKLAVRNQSKRSVNVLQIFAEVRNDFNIIPERKGADRDQETQDFYTNTPKRMDEIIFTTDDPAYTHLVPPVFSSQGGCYLVPINAPPSYAEAVAANSYTYLLNTLRQGQPSQLELPPSQALAEDTLFAPLPSEAEIPRIYPTLRRTS